MKKNSTKGHGTQKELPGKVREALLSVLKARFEKHMGRHKGLKWTEVEARLLADAGKLWSLNEMEESGAALTLESLRRTYRGLLDSYFGTEVVIDDPLELECLRIPHFYSAFYVYKYATGISAAITLADGVLKSGQTDRYFGFLSSGGSKFPIETLTEAGVDMNSPAPVNAALDLFGRRVAELEELLS